jgi:dienelactone hydrolase
MKQIRIFLCVAFIGLLANRQTAAHALDKDNRVMATPITLTAQDGVMVFGSYYKANHPKALILLFHQAGSSKGEYASIAPRLVAAGYSALAIDQRSGGTLFSPNETVLKLGHSAPYLDAQRDLDAALAWGTQTKLPVILWGSSYSAALVFVVAARHPGAVAAVMAFSPGEYFDHATMIRTAAARITAPIYVTSANDAGEIAAALSILAASPAQRKVQYVPLQGGVHGSSTLIAGRNRSGADANWDAVLAFLSQIH